MQGIHLCIHRSQLWIHLRPDLKAFLGPPEPAFKEPVTIDASGQEEWEVEKVLKDQICRKKQQFLIDWKGYDEMEATWEPLDALEGASTAHRTYWFETYIETSPFHLPWTHNNVWSAWTVQQPEYLPLSPELDPDRFWAPSKTLTTLRPKPGILSLLLMNLRWKSKGIHLLCFISFLLGGM